jgi:ATP-dependent Clp protease ATP-binding subunit ClpC
MFERFTEKARRAIFFARYEAGQYGSSNIGAEHLLIGILRDDGLTVLRLLAPQATAEWFRTEIEKQIVRHVPTSATIELPLAPDCRTILISATEEADKLRNRRVRTEHLLLGMLRLKDSLVAQLLREKGALPEAIRKHCRNVIELDERP